MLSMKIPKEAITVRNYGFDMIIIIQFAWNVSKKCKWRLALFVLISNNLDSVLFNVFHKMIEALY